MTTEAHADLFISAAFKAQRFVDNLIIVFEPHCVKYFTSLFGPLLPIGPVQISALQRLLSVVLHR